MIRVLIAAASAVVRAGLESLARSNPTVQVVGHSAGTAALRRDVTALQPDVVLLEQGPHDDDPTVVIAELAGATAVVILADPRDSAWAADLVRAGARAVLPREATAEEIALAVAGAAAGFVMLHSSSAATIVPLLSAAAPPLRGPTETVLTPREVEVLAMLAEGVGNKTIARQLHISEHTVKFHVGSILTKLNATSRTEAVTLGARRGLIML